jgi:hypothetical protein
MKTWLYASIGLCFLFNIIFRDKADSYKRKAVDDPRLSEHFDTQRIYWERALAGSVAIAVYSFFILAFLP